MVKVKSVLLAACCVLALSACDKSERNVIIDKAPFFHAEIPYSADQSEPVIAAVRSFAKEKDMDFLLAQKSLEPGDFNASANSRSLNLKAMHIAAVANGIDVFAIASSDPSPQQKALAREFLERIEAARVGREARQR